ncbi:MAG: hypothetical protein HC877_05750 [Thioploca sp.]|nr:hypothetical protein [Thioploca sp.]
MTTFPTYRRSRFLDLFALLCPIFLFTEIELVGRLFLPELLLAMILPLLILTKGKLLLHPLPRTVIILGILWLGGQIITDLIRNTPFSDWSRGWAKISFLILNFSSIYLLLNNDMRRIVLFSLGFAIGGILDYFISPSEFLLLDPWKFGLHFSGMLIMALLLQWKKIIPFRILSVLFVVALGLFSFYLGTRSIGAVLIVSASYLLIYHQPKLRHWLGKNLSFGQIIVLVIVAALSVWGIITMYSKAASSGWLGENAQAKYYLQAKGDYGFFLGGRVEIIISSQAIINSPILGHGSWAKSSEYRSLLLSLREKGYEVSESAVEKNELIPTHSHLFGAWVEAGILGALFWGWLLIFIFRLLYNLFRLQSDLLPLFVISAMFAIWTILFSPFGAIGRLQWGFLITLFFTAMQFIHHQKPSQPQFTIQ